MLIGGIKRSHHEDLKDRTLSEIEQLKSELRLMKKIQSAIISLMTSRLFEEELRFPSEVISILERVLFLITQKKIVLVEYYRKLDWLEENKENIDTLGEREMNMEDPD